MTETLQDKTDAIFSQLCKANFDDYELECNSWTEANKAIQELREEIQRKKKHRCGDPTIKDYCFDYVLLEDVLALIGEKK